MSDLISRKALVKVILAVRDRIPRNWNAGEWLRGGLHKALRAVETAPAVDAVEVVRCKDCKHRGDGYACPMYFAHMHCEDDDFTSDDGFCERGAKMDMEVSGDV